MRRRLLAGRSGARVAALLAVSLAGCGGSSVGTTSGGPHAAGAGLTVSPRTGTPTSVLRFSFRAPAATGRRGTVDISYTLSIAGPTRTGCVGLHAAGVPPAHEGDPVAVPLGPAQLGGPWCKGRFTARVAEVARPVCKPGQLCPQFIRVVAQVGKTSFTISG